MIPCFMLAPTTKFRRTLRRFTYSTLAPCTGPMGGHDASNHIETVDLPDFEANGSGSSEWPREDERWPLACTTCGYIFQNEDQWQVNEERIFATPDGETTLRDAPVGAMYYAEWYDTIFKPQLEHCLVVIVPPNHPWIVDGQASNCTIKDDYAQERHHCWVIEGTLPNITVGKNGPTCAAGAGSIGTPNWHGFLRNGALVQC